MFPPLVEAWHGDAFVATELGYSYVGTLEALESIGPFLDLGWSWL
jgi:hypothetical protein